MRTRSGTRNRLTLVLAALLTLAAAAWLAAVAFDLVAPGSMLGDLVVPSGSTVAAVVQEYRGWLLPAAIAAVVLAIAAGLALAIAQFPTAPAHTVLRFHDDAGTVLASLEPQVLERALAERVDSVPGVMESSFRVSGSTAALRVLGEVTVAGGAEVALVVDQTRRMLSDDVQTALGTAPQSVDLLVQLRTSRSAPRTDRVAVGQPDKGGSSVSELV